MKSKYSLLLIPVLWCAAVAQVPVAIAPSPHPQFFTSSGLPLSGGFLYTYIAGTTTLSNTYADSTGTVQNPDPIPLDVSGAPSNGTAQTGIWLSNQAFKFCAYNSSMVQQWCTDNVTSYFQLLNFANTWTFQQTFSLPIIDLAADNQIVLGAPGVQTTLDFPPPAGPVTLHFPNTADTMVGRATADTLSKKTFSDYPTVGGSFNIGTVLCLNNTSITQTGDVALHTIYTCTIPAGALGLNRSLRVTVPMLVTSSLSNPSVTVNYGGSRITPPSAFGGGVTNSNQSFVILGGNTGAANAQTWDPINTTVFGSINFAHQTTAVDSTVNQTLTVTFQGGANADSITFFRLLVELL